MVPHQKKIQHLFLRAGFGEPPWRIDEFKDKSIPQVVDQLFADSSVYKDIHYLPYPLKENRQKKGVSAAQVLGMILASKQESEELNLQWLFKLTYTKAVLRERLTFFWHNHFATLVPFSYLMQEQNNTIRKHALGSFRDLLSAVAKDRAMIIYLNNAENKKDHPNENFAREVMELFTVGIGNYSEKDIREAARAFTGWSIDRKGEFVFRPEVHDDGVKTFMGKTGNFKGEDILDSLLADPQTARFVVTKIYKEFVHPVPDEKRVAELAHLFYSDDYDIGKLMRAIFTSEWFYDEKNIGCKIASPVELIVRYNKLLDIRFADPKALIRLQRALGQVLFFPPNVAGWNGGEKWIDSASLLLRLNLPQFILNGSVVGLKAKPAFEEAPEERLVETKHQKVESDWSMLIRYFRARPEEQRLQEMLKSFIQSTTERIPEGLLHPSSVSGSDASIIQLAAQVMALPEFQLI